MTMTVTRYHDISAGHRVFGHESKCKNMHGHNYRIHFTIGANSLDSVGRVLDFSAIKEHLCMWVENEWDHKFLLWDQDPLLTFSKYDEENSFVAVPFNPTAENMAKYLVEVVGPQVLPAGTQLVEVTIEETMKCRVAYTIAV